MTHKKPLGISQGTLNLSRNRNHRILEATLDNSPQNKNIQHSSGCTKTSFKNKTEVTGSEGVYNCPHYSYCPVRSFGRINCLTPSTIKTCATYIFYNKYGKDFITIDRKNDKIKNS